MSRLCFATGCRFCSLCSQQGLLWRNLITLFFTVNNPGEKFSHGTPPQPGAGTLGEHRQRRAMLPRAQQPDAHHMRNAKRKPLKRSTFVFSARAHRAHPGNRARAADGTPDVTHTAPKRGENFSHLRSLFATGFTQMRKLSGGRRHPDRTGWTCRDRRARPGCAPRTHSARTSGAHADTPTRAHDRTPLRTPPMRISRQRHRDGGPHRRRFRHARITLAPAATAQAKKNGRTRRPFFAIRRRSVLVVF